MTIDELQSIARRLSNSGWCRWWCHFNYPNTPSQMAIQVLDVLKFEDGFQPVPVNDIESLGFTLYQPQSDGAPLNYIYLVDRTNADGTPYVSTL